MDQNESNPPPKTGAQRFRRKVLGLMMHRSKRLRSLIRLDAPDIILCNEISMLHKMMSMLDGYAGFLENEAAKEMSKHKNRMGLCARKACFKPMYEGDENSEGEVLCLSCWNKRKQYEDSLEKEAGGMNEDEYLKELRDNEDEG
jgi:hypothetical protein